jgi:hypothetical protein
MMNTAEKTLREEKTIRLMIGMYCQGKHFTTEGMCDECKALYEYALSRIEKCPLKNDKPVCSKCPIHCYKPEMRENIRSVMRYCGPRMMYKHPVLGIRHLLDVLIRTGEIKEK